MKLRVLMVVVTLASGGCKTSEETLVEVEGARLVRVKGVGGGVAVGAPHAPVAIPYITRFEDLRLIWRGRTIHFAEGDLTIPVGAVVALVLDPEGSRFAVSVGAKPATLFHLWKPEAGLAIADPDPLPKGAVNWSTAPRLENRFAALFASMKYPSMLLDEAEARGGKPAVVKLLAETAATAPEADVTWQYAVDHLDPEQRRPVQQALRQHLDGKSPTDAAVRRAIRTLENDEPSLSADALRPLLHRESLAEPDRAALLVLSRTKPGVAELACERLSVSSAGELASAAFMALSVSKHDCPHATAALVAQKCNVVQFGEPDCSEKRARAELAAHIAEAPKSLVHVWPSPADTAFWHACLKGRLPEVVKWSLRRRTYNIDAVQGLWWSDSIARDAACDAPPKASTHTYEGREFKIDDANRKLMRAK